MSTIYSIYFDQLYNYGFKFTHDATLVEDCIQELFIKLIRTRQSLSLPDSVRNYLFKAFRFYIFDKMALRKNLTLEELDDSVDFFLEPASDPEIIKEEIAEEGRQKLARALSKLTPRQREAIYLRYQQGLSYPEISAILSLTQKAAYKLIGRAIQVLRESNGLMLLISGVSVMVAI